MSEPQWTASHSSISHHLLPPLPVTSGHVLDLEQPCSTSFRVGLSSAQLLQKASQTSLQSDEDPAPCFFPECGPPTEAVHPQGSHQSPAKLILGPWAASRLYTFNQLLS